jgi:hypothetical protein
VLAAVCGLFMRNTPGHGRQPPEPATPDA